MSPIDYSGGVLQEFGPKVGETKVIHIRESRKVEDPSGTDEKNFRSTTKNFGYRFELTLTNDRIFLLNVWKLFFAFKDANVQDGDLVQIAHPAAKVYQVTVLERGTGIGVRVEDTEKAKYEASKQSGQAAPAPDTTQAPVTQAPPVAQPAPAPVTQAPATPQVATPPVTQPPVAQPEADEDIDLPF